MFHKILSLIALCAFVFLFSVQAVPAAAQPQTHPLRVTLLLESMASDHGGPADRMRAGLRLAQEQARGSIVTQVVPAPPTSDQTAIFRTACQNADLVLVGEARLHAILRDNAANFRQIKFGCLDTGVRAVNIMSVTFADQEATFLAGAATAMLTKNPRLGWIDAGETPMNETMMQGFLDGAKNVTPAATIAVRHVPFADALAAGAALRDLDGEGCSGIFDAAGYAAKGCYNAIGTTKAVLVGLDADHTHEAPGRVPFSVIKRWDKAVIEIVSSAAAGSFKGGEIIEYALKDHGVDFVINDRLKKTPEGIRIAQRMDELRHEITAGNITLEDRRIPTFCQSCIAR